MPVKVPFLREEQIERDAEALLAEYERARGVRILPPVPIEDIIEKHLKIGVEFDDLHAVLGVPRSGSESEADILGAVFFDDRRIVIDEGLDPEENPAKEGRYRFTLAHESGGHWRLHRHLFEKDPAQRLLFNMPRPPSVVCRSSQGKEPIEWQADCYAGCLLMPRRLVFDAWRERCGSLNPFIYEANRTNPAFNPPRSSWVRLGGAMTTADQEHQFAFCKIAREFAQVFGVSVEAMRIRLENLGLLLRDFPRQRSLGSLDRTPFLWRS
jgi:Zn-dependent peptidase ImmA (M78 family)